MLILATYAGPKPEWVESFQNTESNDWSFYDMAAPMGSQMTPRLEYLLGNLPNLYRNSTTAYSLRICPTMDLPDLWQPFGAIADKVVGIDVIDNMRLHVWRDWYFLLRADALLVDANSSNELALAARILDVPVVAVNYGLTGIHPWLADCAEYTCNSPGTIHKILELLPHPPVRLRAGEASPDDASRSAQYVYPNSVATLAEDENP